MKHKYIYKYELELVDVQQVEMHKDATLLSCQIQRGKLTLWAIVEPANPFEKRMIEILGTGQDMQDIPRTYIATVQDGSFVWHIFEINKPA